MGQKGFGRRTPSRPHAASGKSPLVPEAADGGDPLATSPSAATRRSVAVLAGIACVVTIAAGGFAFALGAASGPGGSSAPGTARTECRPDQVGCTNRYDVRLACGSQQEPRTVSVHAQSPDIAEAKAQRYNQGCRSRGASFVASVMKNAALSYYGGSHTESRMADGEPPRRRYTFRFRRR